MHDRGGGSGMAHEPIYIVLLLLWRKTSTITKSHGKINQSAIVSRSWGLCIFFVCI